MRRGEKTTAAPRPVHPPARIVSRKARASICMIWLVFC